MIETQRVELFRRPERIYANLRRDKLHYEELLVVPWKLASGLHGAVWIASNKPGLHFDSEDLRMIQSLAGLANLALQRSISEKNRRSVESLESAVRLANDLAHEINNPLQALINCLHLVPLPLEDEHLAEARVQAMRLSEQVHSVLEIRRRTAPTDAVVRSGELKSA